MSIVNLAKCNVILSALQHQERPWMVAEVMGLMRAVLTVTADRILGSEGRNAEAE